MIWGWCWWVGMCCSKVVCSKRRKEVKAMRCRWTRIVTGIMVWAARHLFAIASMYSVYIGLSRSLM